MKKKNMRVLVSVIILSIITIYIGVRNINLVKFNEGVGVKVDGRELYETAIGEMEQQQMKELAQCKKAIKEGKLKVAFLGDSITEGADLLDGSNSYTNKLIHKLKEELPGVTIETVNFSLGGRSIMHCIRDDYKAVGVETNYLANFTRPWSVPGKPWKDHVKDFSPDLLIIAFGMNEAFNIKYSDELFYENLKALDDYTRVWSKVPDKVLVTTILPTTDKNRYGQRQDITNNMATVARSYAKEKNYICADAGRLFQILRDGRDVVAKETKVYKQWEKVKDFQNGTIEFNGKFSKVGLEGSGDIVYRSSDLGNVTLRLEAKEDNKGEASLYFNDSEEAIDKEGKPYKTVEVDNLKLNATNKIKIEVSDIEHKLYINDKLVLDVISYKKLTGGKVLIKSKGVAPFKVKDLNIAALKGREGTPVYSEEELIGTFNTPGKEGNGINHPTALGHQEIYVKAFNNLIKTLGNTCN